LKPEVIRFISRKKEEPEWMTELRLKAYHKWLEMEEPHWGHLEYEPFDYQSISYFAAPKKGPESLDEVDPKILEAYEKLGIPLEEQKQLAGVKVAVDAVVGDPPPPHPPASSARANPSPMNRRMVPSTSGSSRRAHRGPGHRPRR
jgi:hypothetical protein